MRSTEKRKPADNRKIQALIDHVADCQQQAVNLKLGLIHYFLDMASSELKLMQNEDLKSSASISPAQDSSGSPRRAGTSY